MVASSGDEAVANAKRYTRCVPGMCLKYTRTWLEIPGRELDAISAWNTAKHKHSGDRKPPRGAPVFWRGGAHGHIALAVNNDQFRSTDTTSSGIVSTQDERWWEQHWGATYLGWTEDLNGVDIPYLRGGSGARKDWRASGKVYVSKLREGVTKSDSVSRLRYRLTNHPDMPKGKQPGSGAAYGDATVEAVKWWQRNVAGIEDGQGRDMSNAQANRLFGDNYQVIEE